MVGELADNEVDILIELEQYRSLGSNPTDVKEMTQKAEASTELMEQARRYPEESEKELLAYVKMRKEQVRLADEGILWFEGRAKESDQYSAQLEAKVSRHQGELSEDRAKT